jgi:hypothetical protein
VVRLEPGVYGCVVFSAGETGEGARGKVTKRVGWGICCCDTVKVRLASVFLVWGVIQV